MPDYTTHAALFCPLCGLRLIETGLGIRYCNRCVKHFVQSLDPYDGTASLDWTEEPITSTCTCGASDWVPTPEALSSKRKWTCAKCGYMPNERVIPNNQP